MASVSATLGSGYRVGITARGHTWTADEPVDKGGDDQGPNPYELLLGGLAACTCMTVRMYAERKDWPLESVTVVLTHDRVHADDCEECDDDVSGYIDRVRARIELIGDGLDDEQHDRLMEIAGRCPVRKTLTKGVTVVDEALSA